MDDELRQVQEEIAATKEKLTRAEIEATKADLTEADRQRNLDLVLALTNLQVTLTNLQVRLYDEKARVEARLSAGEIYYNRGVCDILRFLPRPCS
jgi:allophanate hydrolase subunit 1